MPDEEIPDLVYRLMSQLAPVVNTFVDSLNDDEVNELFKWARGSDKLIAELQKAMFGKLQ